MNKRHDLIDIYYRGTSDEEDVVRWCRKCGAIVVDVDVDNRTSPGAIMPMRVPQMTKDNHCLKS